VRMPSRRKIDQRLSVIDEMLASNDVELKGKVVLDIGCNFGMAISQYLKHGAKWCHGWDMPETLKHTGKLLPAIGCTRFSLTGGELQKEQELENDVPEFVRRSLEGCVISYLSERMRVGWLDSLSSIHWSHLIYEEHQGDDFESDMNDFAKLVDFDILEARKYSDGLSDDRTIAILKRKY